MHPERKGHTRLGQRIEAGGPTSGLVDFTEEHGERCEQPFRLRQRGRPVFGRRGGSPARRLRRLAMALVTLVLTLVLFGALAVGVLFLRLSRGPISVALEQPIAKALATRVSHGFQFDVGGTSVQSVEGRPTLVVDSLSVVDAAGRTVLKAPRATVAVDPMQMLGGAIVPTRFDIQDVTLRLVILPDGDVALSAGTDATLPFRLSEAFEAAAPSPPKAETAAPGSSATPPAISEPAASQAASDQVGTTSPRNGAVDRDAFDRLAALLLPVRLLPALHPLPLARLTRGLRKCSRKTG